ncbi:MAG: glycosyltransferase [Prevotella sp.]|jgi:glycosyltransferase involved in cell wall biosynthesis|nr:glycosyltransferase [Prevotella sp.]
MKKVIFFVTGLNSGGIENYLLRFLQYKATFFSEIVIYCKGGMEGQLDEDFLIIPNVKILRNEISFFNPFHYIKLKSYLEKQKFDAMCDFTGNFAGLILLCGKKAGINKRIVFYRSSSDRFSKTLFKTKYNNFVKKLTYENATNILSNSRAAFDFFYKKNQHDKRFQVIYNGIDAANFNVGNHNLRQAFNIPENAFVIGHTGRFNPAKNHDVILMVAVRLLSKYPDIYFILCGNGVRNGLENKIKELDIDDKTRLFENRNDIPLFLNTMDIYFFPSITEGQPNALIEAMIMGIPFVASDIPPIKETVEDYPNLYNPLDIEGFTDALESLYLNGVQKDINLQKKAISRFNYKERFDEFYNNFL